MDGFLQEWPSAVTIGAIVASLILIKRFLTGRSGASANLFRNQVLLIGLSAVAIVAIILVLPVGDSTQGALLSFLGIVSSAAIALSSTTFLGNALAGLMLRAVRNFSVGDFVRVESHFGRVSERGLFHTEIQTEDRELTTLPNLFLVTHPVTTVRSSGTVIAASLTLGYDVPQGQVKELLLAAATEAGLHEPFVQILELGDFSVEYRVAGLLEEVKVILSARSLLRSKILESFHTAGVEIVSPTFMNTRALPLEMAVVPVPSAPKPGPEGSATPEELVFDKAEEAGAIQKLQRELAELVARIQEMEARQKGASKEEKNSIGTELELLGREREALEATLTEKEESLREKERAEG